MSAAEQAHPGPDQHGTDLAPVLVLSLERSPRRRSNTRRSERTHVPAQPDGELTPHERIAASLESKLAAIGRTLTDEATADGFRTALQEVRRLLEGARIHGLLSEDGYKELDTMVEAMMDAPGLLTQ